MPATHCKCCGFDIRCIHKEIEKPMFRRLELAALQMNTEFLPDRAPHLPGKLTEKKRERAISSSLPQKTHASFTGT
jgi:hypothetical protein